MRSYSPRAIGGVATGLTADVGSVQAGATLCDSGVNVFGTVGTAGDSAVLPANVAQYRRIVVRNDSATSMDLFPNVGATINGGSVDAAIAVGAGVAVEVMQIAEVDGLTWIEV